MDLVVVVVVGMQEVQEVAIREEMEGLLLNVVEVVEVHMIQLVLIRMLHYILLGIQINMDKKNQVSQVDIIQVMDTYM